MKTNKIIGLLPLFFSLIGSSIPFSNVNNIGVNAENLSEKDLYFAPASAVVNNPYSYLNSPTNEPWYYTSHSYKNTSDTTNTYYPFNQGDTTYKRMNVENTWNSYRGENVKVAIIDTGCYTSHEDFNGSNISIKSKNFVSGYSGLSAVNDTSGHGTYSASTIAAAINNVGGTGIAPNAEIYILKCVNSSNVFDNSSILKALQFCIDNDIDVINMSIQGYTSSFNSTYVEDFGNVTVNTTSTGIMSSTYLSTKIEDCYKKGITIVAAAGNYNSSNKSYPAANDHVIAVASTGLLEENKYKKAGFSNYGDWVDICAPGYITTPTLSSSSSYSVTYGTSFSAPLVTGAIALYKSKYPNASPDQIEEALKFTATPVTWKGGAGAINVEAFLNCEPDKINPEELNIPEDNITLKVGDTYQINPLILPEGANQSVGYMALEDDIISISDTGLITALKPGEDYVSCYSEEKDSVDATIDVTVVDSNSTSKTTFNASDFSGGTSGTGSPISKTISPITITLSKGYKASSEVRNYANGTMTFECLNGWVIRSIQIKISDSSKTGKTNTVTSGGGTITNNSTNGIYTADYRCGETPSGKVIIKNGSQIAFSSIIVEYAASSKILESISVNKTKEDFVLGDSFIKNEITANYKDLTSVDITDKAIFSGYNLNKLGEQTVLVSYTEGGVNKTCSYIINVHTELSHEYCVTFNPNGGSLETYSESVTALLNEEITLPTLSRDGYEFLGWSKTQSSTSATYNGGSTFVVTENVTLYAIWSKIKVITYKVESSVTSIPFMSGTNHSVPVTANLYRFVDGVRDSIVKTESISIDTSSLGNKPLNVSYNNEIYSGTVKVTNKNASVGTSIPEASETTTKDNTVEWMPTSNSPQVSTGWTLSYAKNKVGYEGNRGLQIQKGTLGLVTSNINNIKSIYIGIARSSSGVGTVTLSLENEQLLQITSFSTNVEDKSYTFNPLKSGKITLNINCTNSSIYIKYLRIIYQTTTTVTVPGVSYDATALQQAKAWANYFVNETRTQDTCLAATNEAKLLGLKSKWEDLANEYTFMNSEAKSIFFNSDDIDIVTARDHYRYIVSKFGASNLGTSGAFVKDASNNQLPLSSPIIHKMEVNNQLSVIMIISLIGITSIGAYYFHKRKEQ